MFVISSEMVGNSTLARMHLTTAKRFFIDFFSGRSFHKWRTSQKYSTLFADNDILIRHCRDVCTTFD
jgi:hypothetical protein